MKNKLTDLNNYLFETIEKLLDDEVCSDKETTATEIAKAKVICDVSSKIIDINKTQLEAVKVCNEYNLGNKELPDTLAIGDK